MKSRFLLGVLCTVLSVQAQTPLRLSGSTTVKGVLEPKQAALEAAVGRQVEFSGTGTNTGLMSLATGSADVAMLSTPLEEVAKAINEKHPGRVDPAQFDAVRIGEVKIVFIVNPRNPVRTLTSAQLADILLGKIVNWKQVGGANAPIVVVSLANGGHLLQEQLLHGSAITETARSVPNAMQIPVVVAQDPNAIGIISTAHARGHTSVIQTDANVVTPLFLVTKGAPTPDAKKLVEVARSLLGTSS